MVDAISDTALRRLHDEGARPWPGIVLPVETFAASLAERGIDPTATTRAADLYLAHACAAGLRAAVEAFDRVYLSQVEVYLARRRPSPAVVDEVRQVLREKLLVGKPGTPPRILEYDGSGALESWVRVVAVRAAIDLHRRRGAVAPAGPGEPEARGGPEESYLRRRYRESFHDALRAAIADLDAEQRRILRLHLVDGVTLDQLASMYGVHRATVARKLAAARAAVKDDARRRLRTALGATDSELTSLAGVIRSELNLSLPRLLAVE